MRCTLQARCPKKAARLAESHPQIDFRFFVLLSQTTERLSLLEFYTMNVDLLCWFWDEVSKDNFRESRSATLQLQLALSSLFSCTSVQFIFSNLLFQSSVFSTVTTRLLCALPDGAGAIWREQSGGQRPCKFAFLHAITLQTCRVGIVALQACR